MVTSALSVFSKHNKHALYREMHAGSNRLSELEINVIYVENQQGLLQKD